MACEVMLPIQMLTMINTIMGENTTKPKWLFSKKGFGARVCAS